MFDLPGSFGIAIVFMCTMAALGIFGPLWLCYGSHCFLTVLTESSIGDREVNWPDEVVIDWWWKPFYCLGLLSVWASAGSTLVAPLLFVAPPWIFGGAAALLVWFAYPIGLLCVMEAQSALALVHLPLFARLGRYAGAVLVVGLGTLPLGVAVGGLLALAILRGAVWAIPTAFVLPVAVLLYARSWGRLAWMVLNVKPRRKPDEPPAEEPPPEAAAVSSHDPWAAPAEEIPEMDVAVEETEQARAVAKPDELVPPLPFAIDEWDESPVPYDVPATAPAEAPFSHDEYYRQYRKREELRRARAEGRQPGEKRRRRASLRTAFGADFWPFLFEHRTLRVGLSLGVLTLIVLLLVRIIVAMLFGG